MRQKIMQKMIVPIALAAALTLHSPFLRAGEGTRLMKDKAPMGLATPERAHRRGLDEKTASVLCEREPAQMDEHALEVKAKPTVHEDGRKAGAPGWLAALVILSSLVNVGLFYGGTVRKVWKTKDTGSFSKSSRLIMLAGSLLWLGYNVLFLKDWKVAAITVFILPGSIYIAYRKLKNKDKPKPLEPRQKKVSHITTGVAAVAVAALAAFEILWGNTGIGILATAMGGMAIFLRDLNPWIQAIKTLTDKSTKSFPNWKYYAMGPPESALWAAYGLFQGEVFLMVSNTLSIATCFIMALMVWKNRKKDAEADGSQSKGATTGSARSTP